jgi:hypothetical protein
LNALPIHAGAIDVVRLLQTALYLLSNIEEMLANYMSFILVWLPRRLYLDQDGLAASLSIEFDVTAFLRPSS